MKNRRLMWCGGLVLMILIAGAMPAAANTFVVTVTGTIGAGNDHGPLGHQGNLAGKSYRAVETFVNVPGAETTTSTYDQLYGTNIAAFGPVGLTLTVGDYSFTYAVPSSPWAAILSVFSDGYASQVTAALGLYAPVPNASDQGYQIDFEMYAFSRNFVGTPLLGPLSVLFAPNDNAYTGYDCTCGFLSDGPLGAASFTMKADTLTIEVVPEPEIDLLWMAWLAGLLFVRRAAKPGAALAT